MVKKKQYTNVVDMVRDLTEDHAFADDLRAHLAQRRLVTELVALRAAKGLSQQQVAAKLGCTQGRISKVEASSDGDLSLGTLINYAGALEFEIELTLVGADATIVDRVKHHAFCIKRLTDRLARFGARDRQIADGVGDFLKEAAYNLVRLVRNSAKLLPSPPAEPRPPIAIDVYGMEGQEDESCEYDREAEFV